MNSLLTSKFRRTEVKSIMLAKCNYSVTIDGETIKIEGVKTEKLVNDIDILIDRTETYLRDDVIDINEAQEVRDIIIDFNNVRTALVDAGHNMGSIVNELNRIERDESQLDKGYSECCNISHFANKSLNTVKLILKKYKGTEFKRSHIFHDSDAKVLSTIKREANNLNKTFGDIN